MKSFDEDDEELELLVSQASRYGLRLGPLPMQEVAGSLRVRVMSAVGLAAADKHLMSASSSDPYAILKLKDDHSYLSERWTYPKEQTLNPVWSEEFRFGVRKQTGTLTLQVDVMDDNSGKQGAFLGKAVINLDMRMMQDNENEWCKYVCDLRPDKRSVIKPRGKVELRLYWEPWMGRGWCSLMGKILQSRKACGIVGALVTVTMSPLLSVAADSRWLCLGETLHSCTPVSSGSRQAATDVASVATRICGIVHFLGAMGMFGRLWETGLPRIFELVEDPDQESTENRAVLHPTSLGGDEQGLDLHLLVKRLGPHDVSFNLGVGNLRDLSGKTLVMMLRYTAWVAHAIALAMLTLSVSIVVVHLGDGVILAEGAYLTVFIDMVLLWTFYLFFTNSRRGIDLKRDDDIFTSDSQGNTLDAPAPKPKPKASKPGNRLSSLREPLVEP
mmetsp:Transcript_28601/g.66262  ORF Transcript_28601/g.66262 Transcript_28601/m.66262 type:complete len:443 (+) Transcript_28601:57-1385(+)